MWPAHCKWQGKAGRRTLRQGSGAILQENPRECSQAASTSTQELTWCQWANQRKTGRLWKVLQDFWKMLLKQSLSFNSLKCAADYSRALECQNALRMNLELERESSCGKKSGGCGQWASPSPAWLFRWKSAGGMWTDDWTTSPSKLDLKLCFPKIAIRWALPLQALGSHPYTSLRLVSLDFPF